MAVYNEIQIGRYNRFLQKLLSMKGGAPAGSLASEIYPVLPLEVFGVENRYLVSWERFGFQAFVAGVALVNGGARFRNATGSNMIAVIEKVTIVFAAVDIVQAEIAPQTADLASVQATGNIRFDRRGRSMPTLSVSQSTAAGAGPASPANYAAVGAVNTQEEMITFDDHELAILPGDALSLYSTTNNTALRVSVWWRERFLEDSERT
jgi:hypothetical protein